MNQRSGKKKYMIAIYLKTAYRSLVRNKHYTIFNIIGLTISISVCLLIFIIVQYETSYDDFHKNGDNIYRVVTKFDRPIGDSYFSQGVPYPLPRMIKNEFSQIKNAATIVLYPNSDLIVLDKNGQAAKKFKENSGVFFTEPSFFNIFNFSFLIGSPETSLKDVNSVILTKEIAIKYFGDYKSAMGGLIKLNNQTTLKVSGILNTIPENSDFQLRVILQYNTNFFPLNYDWRNLQDNYQYFITLAPNSEISKINSQLSAFSVKYRPIDFLKYTEFLQPLNNIHSNREIGNFTGKTTTINQIQTMSLIAVFILLIGCINFINLATSQAINRAKEICVRKVLGSSKLQLRFQFLIETLLIVLVSVVFSIGTVLLLLSFTSNLLEITLSFSNINLINLFVFILVTILLVTFLAGFYPSIILSRYNPVEALKNKFSVNKSSSGISLRRVLVIFQFITAQSLIIGTVVIIEQMSFLKHGSMGFDKNAVVNLSLPNDDMTMSKKFNQLTNQLLQINGVKQVSFNSSAPANDDNSSNAFKFDHSTMLTYFYPIVKFIDTNYIGLYKIPLVAGRNINAADSVSEFLVNEALVKKLGLKNPQDIINKEADLVDGYAKGLIVGVLKDFHSTSFKNSYNPVLLTNKKAQYRFASIKFSSNNVEEVLATSKKIWNEAFPNYVFEYQFLDVKIDGFYKHENQLAEIYKSVSAVAIFVSCLGLFGLASFMSMQRTKEVGIRKVLGASPLNIVFIFSREFVTLISIAFLISSPITLWFTSQWLQKYAFRIVLNGWIFLFVGIGSILIAVITISYYALTTALANPVNALKAD